MIRKKSSKILQFYVNLYFLIDYGNILYYNGYG